MHALLAALATGLLYLLTKRYTNFVESDFNTLAFTDPSTVPGATPTLDGGDPNDGSFSGIGESLTIPMCEVASGFGVELSPNPLNPTIPPAQYGNKNLDSPSLLYVNPTTPATG